MYEGRRDDDDGDSYEWKTIEEGKRARRKVKNIYFHLIIMQIYFS